jgi:acetyl-CoA carboxylase biotin carboxyl carrier protein
MDIKEIKKLIEMVSESNLQEFEYTQGDAKIRIVRGTLQTMQMPVAPQPMLTAQSTITPTTIIHPSEPAPGPAQETVIVASDEEVGLITINSPMVGTFYRASAPDAAPFVDVGSTIEVDQTVCIIEAMKLMNEIKTEVRGKIVQILIENGHAVEFGQPLFKIKKL